MICVSIGRTRHKMMALEQQALSERGAEMIELRLDYLSRLPDINRFLKNRTAPVVMTCRRQEDRGRWRWDETARQTVLRTAIVAEADYVDLEEDIARKIPRFGKTKRIVSYHNFDETPDDLNDIYARMTELDADVLKIVTMANAPSDSVRMLQLVANSKMPTVGFCMGELGLVSRVLCGKYGSPFTYATFSSDRQLAPGQLSVDVMQNLYRYNAIGAETEVFGVLGDPIAHSLSPLLHNRAFQHHKMNRVYLPLRVPRDRLRQTLEDFEWLGIKGYSVTIPHKETVIPVAAGSDAAVKAIGAANTLYRTGTGGWHASNTDCDAAVASIRLALREDDDTLKGRKAVVLGAGGAARAVVYGLLQAGAFVTIANRTNSKAERLAAEMGCQVTRWEHRGTDHFDVLVNCTSVGMYPNMNETPFPENWLRDGAIVFDTVYNPENTLLIKQARERGCRVVSGIEMFIRQAAAQFELFTGFAPELETFRETLRQSISAVNYAKE